MQQFLVQKLGQPAASKEELDQIELDAIKEVQAEAFQKEIELCAKAKERTGIRKVGQLNGKQTFLDNNGTLRLVTRLTNAEFLSYNTKYPVILPAKHAFTRLVIRSCHEAVGHLGAGSTRVEVNRRFHVPKLVSTVKREVFQCKVCRVNSPAVLKAPLAPLHESRLQFQKHPFAATGVDFFGPFLLQRGQKRWGLLFTCLTTRAVHLEDTASMSLEAVLLAMERFIQRRGKPNSMQSDQGTQSVAAAKELNKVAEVLAKELQQGVQSKWSIKWKFNPARAPHWGGAWERIIKDIKRILEVAIGSVARLTSVKPNMYSCILMIWLCNMIYGLRLHTACISERGAYCNITFLEYLRMVSFKHGQREL